MKQTLKATAVTLGFIAAVVLFNYFMEALGCLMIYLSETCNAPL